jgi:hypothetical protein
MTWGEPKIIAKKQKTKKQKQKSFIKKPRRAAAAP